VSSAIDLELAMNLEAFPDIRSKVETVLKQHTADLDPQTVHAMVKSGIDAELQARREAQGGGSTLTLNALLDLEMQLRTKVFGLKRETIKPGL
jgi:hypothetical protein